MGGKGATKEIVVVAAEENGRVRMTHAPGNHAEALKVVAEREIADKAAVKTDGHAGYSVKSLGERPHEAVVQTKAEKKEGDVVQLCHWTVSLLKRWLIGTHAGAVAPKHLQAYLDEYAFRYNRRRTNGVGRIAARVIECLVVHAPRTMRAIVEDTKRSRWFKAKSATTAPESSG